ncbi:MAG: DegT/DnrJ/EryC1/StrS family aminotransferase [Verrucomicrobiota bacterium]
MQFIDIKAIHARSSERIDTAIASVLEHGRFINGPEVNQLEATLAEHLGSSTHCIAVASGTMALEIALRGLGIGPGDEVITTPFTWISSAETIALVGATPVFVDIDPKTYNIDPEKIEAAITSRTKAMIPVNLFGQMADYGRIKEIAKNHGLKIIEDAAQSFGAEQNGRKSCTVGDVSCTSFFPAKPFGCYGDGGAVFTQDADLAEDLRAITNHGGKVREHHYLLGTNGRCDSLQAAIMLAKFPAFQKDEIQLRQAVGERYTKALEDACVTPSILPGNTHIYAQYTIRSKDRDGLGAALKKQGIPSAVYYRKCLHEQPVFAHYESCKQAFPYAEQATQDVISLPFHPYLTAEDQDTVINAVLNYDCD